MSATAELLQKPITGGVFGRDRYALASMPCVSRGLHSTRYMVVDPRAGAVLSMADDKVEAIAGARRLITAGVEFAQSQTCWKQLDLGLAETTPARPASANAPQFASVLVSRRRREIFEKCAARCHYCGSALALDGKWHVEHMMPRALGGGDDARNLVAACAPCNLSKSDRTAIEFVIDELRT